MSKKRPNIHVNTSNARQRKHAVGVLLDLDGPNCYFCHEATTDDDRTIEHLIAKVDGGRDNIRNLRLAHGECNERAGDLSVMAKRWIRRRLARGRRSWVAIEGEVKRKRAMVAKRRKGWEKVTQPEEKSAERALRSWGLDT